MPLRAEGLGSSEPLGTPLATEFYFKNFLQREVHWVKEKAKPHLMFGIRWTSSWQRTQFTSQQTQVGFSSSKRDLRYLPRECPRPLSLCWGWNPIYLQSLTTRSSPSQKRALLLQMWAWFIPSCDGLAFKALQVSNRWSPLIKEQGKEVPASGQS